VDSYYMFVTIKQLVLLFPCVDGFVVQMPKSSGRPGDN
ncbi:hypothetical protein PR003_g19949, partial [Phytophthora rubi]